MLAAPKAGSAQTHARIVDVARGLLAKGGVEVCSMRAVAEGSGITAAAISRHFEDKATLVDHVVGLAFASFEQSLLEAMAPLPVGSFARLSAVGEAYIRFAREHEEEFKVLFMPLGGDRKRLSDMPGHGGYPLLRQCVVEAMEEGTLRAADPDLVSLFLWSRVHGIVMLLLACDLDEIVEVEDVLSPIDLFARTQPFLVEGLRE